MVRKYIKNILIAFDQLVNAILFGDPDETISSKLGKSQRGDYGTGLRILLYPFAKIVDCVFYILGDKNHCQTSIEEDEGNNDLMTTLYK